MTVLRDIDTVIIHVPKTGGSSVRWPAIRKFGIRYSCQHCNYKMLPEKFKDFRKITFTRNPIDWYASRYFFDKQKLELKRPKLEPFTDALSEGYKQNFEVTLKRMLDLTEAFRDPDILALFKQRVQRELTNNYQCWWVSYFDDIDEITPESFENKSLYQWFNDKLGLDKCVAVYHLEDQHKLGMKREFGEDINIIHKNKTGRSKSEDIYSLAMRKSVLEKEANFIKKYGYYDKL